METPLPRFFRFSHFEIDTKRKRIRKEGRIQRLAPKAFEVLCFLVQNKRRVVETDEILDAIWKDEPVEERNVKTYISAVRRFLGETPKDHKYIVTHPKKGYEFVADVSESTNDKVWRPGQRSSTEHDLKKLKDELAMKYGVCIPDERTESVLNISNYDTSLAVDGCLDLCHSRQFRGWSKRDLVFKYMEEIPLPIDLEELNKSHPPSGRNGGKWRMHSFLPNPERSQLEIKLCPADYYSTAPIHKHLHGRDLECESCKAGLESRLLGSRGEACTPLEKYGKNAGDAWENGQLGRCRLPNIVCLHVIVVLPEDTLLLTQRVKGQHLDWQRGKWSISFEEQMSPDPYVRAPRPPDLDFFDTVKAGLDEELGCSCGDDDIEILSLTIDSGALNIDPIALVRVQNSLGDVRERWKLMSQDGRIELRRVEQVEWSIEGLAPILCGAEIQIENVRIKPDEWNLTSRMRGLVALFNKYGVAKTIEGLNEWCGSNLRRHKV